LILTQVEQYFSVVHKLNNTFRPATLCFKRLSYGYSKVGLFLKVTYKCKSYPICMVVNQPSAPATLCFKRLSYGYSKVGLLLKVTFKCRSSRMEV